MINCCFFTQLVQVYLIISINMFVMYYIHIYGISYQVYQLYDTGTGPWPPPGHTTGKPVGTLHP